MKQYARNRWYSVALIALLSGCVTTPTSKDEPVSTNARCEQTGSNLPRRECRNDVQTLKSTEIESLKGAERPTMRGN
jgi:PBP1b-binding outer membrane lipoprotein LpoB